MKLTYLIIQGKIKGGSECEFMTYSTYFGQSPIKVKWPISTQAILLIKDQWASPVLISGHTLPFVAFKPPEQWPIFGHTIDLVCTPSNTFYIHHEALGGTEADGTNPGRVTVELDGKTETMELKSIL